MSGRQLSWRYLSASQTVFSSLLPGMLISAPPVITPTTQLLTRRWHSSSRGQALVALWVSAVKEAGRGDSKVIRKYTVLASMATLWQPTASGNAHVKYNSHESLGKTSYGFIFSQKYHFFQLSQTPLCNIIIHAANNPLQVTNICSFTELSETKKMHALPSSWQKRNAIFG